MFLDYHLYIASLLPELALELFPEEEHRQLRQEMKRYRGYEVSACPHPEDGALASNVAFVLAKSLLKHTEFAAQPLRIAESVTELSRRFKPESFELSVGGGGFLNAFPTREYLASFWSALAKSGAGYLFQLPAELSAGEFPPVLMEAQIDQAVFTATKNRVAPTQEEAGLLLANRESTGRPWSVGEYLQLLASMGDPEIDMRPFLLGLKGSQNIPWYIERFQYDVDRYLGQTPREQLWELSVQEWERVLRSGGILDLPMFKPLLHFRRGLLISLRFKRPEILMASTLGVIREFYTFFHRPEMRAVRLAGSGSAGGTAYPLAEAVRDLVAQALHLLTISREIDIRAVPILK